MLSILRKILLLFTPRERGRGAILLLLMMTMAGMEVAGIVSVAPFLAVLGNPELIGKNPYLAKVFTGLGFSATKDFLVALGLLALVVLVASAAFRALVHYAQYRFVDMRRHNLSYRLLAKYLRQPYPFFLRRNSSEMSKTILSEVDHVIVQAVLPMLHLLSYGLVAIAMVVLLLVVDPVLALLLAGVLGGIYSLIYLSIRGFLGRIGKERREMNSARFKITAETLGGIKELKVLGREQIYLNAFSYPSLRYSLSHAASQTLADVPRFIVEAIGFVAILLAALYLLDKEVNLGQVLPVLGLYVFAGYRLLPAVQNIYAATAKLRFSAPSLDAILDDLAQTSEYAGTDRGRVDPLPLRHSVELKSVDFRYPGRKEPAISAIDLVIRANTSIGIVGSTGAGKSTLVDLLLGLLRPGTGEILIDRVLLDESNTRSWQRGIGYVPQHIFLADDTVTRNIAFGVPDHEVDLQAVEIAARTAQVHDFITQELPQGYSTLIGERGVRLSGGQRQRVGIARALYRDPAVLLLDEATSALDTLTERAVMDTVYRLGRRKTIIIIAHRLSTVRTCDRIFMLEHGRLVAQGTYDDLIRTNDQFRVMAARS